MTSFKISEVIDFAKRLNIRMDQCTNGEGNHCATLEAFLKCQSDTCDEFLQQIYEWRHAVFSGSESLDEAVEQQWLTEAKHLHQRAKYSLAFVKQKGSPCGALDRQQDLEITIAKLDRMITGWSSPQLSVAPSARRKSHINPDMLAEARQKIAALPNTPSEWVPSPEQLALYQLLKPQ